MTPIYVVGDPHGRTRIEHEIIPELLRRPPGVVVLAGDIELDQPFRTQFKPLFDAGHSMHWILGNHDVEFVENAFFLLHPKLGYPEGNLHLKVLDVAGLRVTGLGGIFKSRVWSPPKKPVFASRQAWFETNKQTWRGGLPLHMVDTIWPEDYAAALELKVDLLVTHEGTSAIGDNRGFQAIDDLAAAQGCRYIAHGHHHWNGPLSPLDNGVVWKSLAKAEVWECPQ
jgi:predicted phosphodiesterase